LRQQLIVAPTCTTTCDVEPVLLFAVVPTHELGKRRTKAEMAAAQQTIGSLKIFDCKDGNAFGRAVRVAELHDESRGYLPTLLPQLFHASVVKVTFSEMLITGFELSSETGVLTEYKQGWWAKAVKA
jgi:hypothetical protein